MKVASNPATGRIVQILVMKIVKACTNLPAPDRHDHVAADLLASGLATGPKEHAAGDDRKQAGRRQANPFQHVSPRFHAALSDHSLDHFRRAGLPVVFSGFFHGVSKGRDERTGLW